jgi:hypothetical protein
MHVKISNEHMEKNSTNVNNQPTDENETTTTYNKNNRHVYNNKKQTTPVKNNYDVYHGQVILSIFVGGDSSVINKE